MVAKLENTTYIHVVPEIVSKCKIKPWQWAAQLNNSVYIHIYIHRYIYGP